MNPDLDKMNSLFENLEIRIFSLALASGDEVFISSELQRARSMANRLILYDPITGAMNLRAEKWLIPAEQIKSVAKIDWYDLKQANRVYGRERVDAEMRRLAILLCSAFTEADGYYVYRTAGSDEIKIISIDKYETVLLKTLSQLHAKDQSDQLIPWDFGVGNTYKQAEAEIVSLRKKTRPQVVRQTVLVSHSDIPTYHHITDSMISRDDFLTPYMNMSNRIKKLCSDEDTFIETEQQILSLRYFVEELATQDELTKTLNALGKCWYVDSPDYQYQCVALTDMLDMHEANIKFGDHMVDADLKRFANLLLSEFRPEDGFFVCRSARDGDEFFIFSSKVSHDELEKRFIGLFHRDRDQGLLRWNYGIGKNEMESHNNLYHNRISKASGPVDKSRAHSAFEAIYLLACPRHSEYDRILDFATDIAKISQGTVIKDLHFTLQSMRDGNQLSSLIQALKKYCSEQIPFTVNVRNMARVNLNNQPARIWFMLEKTPTLAQIYTHAASIARACDFSPYPYPVEEWKPHMKAVILSHDSPPTMAHPIFENIQLSFLVDQFQLTAQTGEDEWETLDYFEMQK